MVPVLIKCRNNVFNISVGRVGRQNSFQLKLEIGLSLATSKVNFLSQIAIALNYTKDISGKLCEIGRGKIVITLGYIRHQVIDTLSVQHHTMFCVNAFIYRFIYRCII